MWYSEVLQDGIIEKLGPYNSHNEAKKLTQQYIDAAIFSAHVNQSFEDLHPARQKEVMHFRTDLRAGICRCGFQVRDDTRESLLEHILGAHVCCCRGPCKCEAGKDRY